nr:MAG TPA: hypothetical protein [Caudoviricetes sp.]
MVSSIPRILHIIRIQNSLYFTFCIIINISIYSNSIFFISFFSITIFNFLVINN